MSFLGRIRGDDDQDRADSGLAHVARVLVDGFDDWGLLFAIVSCVVGVVFVAVSLFGALLSGEGIKGLGLK